MTDEQKETKEASSAPPARPAAPKAAKPKPESESGGPKKSWRAPRRHANYTPNLTPLIDVLFLLLLFFLLGSKFRQQEGAIPGSLPKMQGGIDQGTKEPVGAKTILNINLMPEGANWEDVRYSVGGTPVGDAKQLFERLDYRRKQYGSNADNVQIVIMPRGNVRWQYVVEAFNQAMRAQFKNIGFAPAT